MSLLRAGVNFLIIDQLFYIAHVCIYIFMVCLRDVECTAFVAKLIAGYR